MVFANRLRETLSIRKMSQNELAQKLEMSPDAVSSYCVGKRMPPLNILVLICKTLNESSDYLLGLTDIPN